jgi:hypothetical protein
MKMWYRGLQHTSTWASQYQEKYMVPHSVRIRPAKTRRLLLLRYFATSGLTAENFPNEPGTHRLELHLNYPHLNRCRCTWNWELQGRATSAGGRKPLVGISSFVLFPPFKNKHNAVHWALRSQQGCLRGLGFHLGPLLQGSGAVI